MNPRITPVLVIAVVVAGCGGGHKAVSPPRSPASPAPVATTTRARPAAADGTDLSACREGRCEVSVSPYDAIHPAARYGVARLTVQSITEDGVTYLGTGPGITLTLGGQQPGMTSYMNDLAITTVAVDGETAIMRLAPK